MQKPLSEMYYKYINSVVPDAGAGMLHNQPYGHPGEVYPCPRHKGRNCSMCGGSRYRAVCNATVCHEYGCQYGNCGRTEEDYKNQALK